GGGSRVGAPRLEGDRRRALRRHRRQRAPRRRQRGCRAKGLAEATEGTEAEETEEAETERTEEAIFFTREAEQRRAVGFSQLLGSSYENRSGAFPPRAPLPFPPSGPKMPPTRA